MKHRIRSFPAACAAAAMILAGSASARAQITVAEGYTPPDDTPAVNVGGTIFANYTYQLEPTVTNSQGDRVHPSSFDVTRAYINVTGQINHLINFRITPDVVRVGQVDGKDVPGITGTLTYRLKYAYGQLNFSRLHDEGLVDAAGHCSRRPSSTSKRGSTATGSRGPSRRTAKDS